MTTPLFTTRFLLCFKTRLSCIKPCQHTDIFLKDFFSDDRFLLFFSNLASSLPSDGQNIGASASTLVLPMNTQDWFPLGLTGWISLLSKGLSRVFCSTTVQKHQFLGTHGSILTSGHDYWINHSLTSRSFVGKVMSLLLNTLSRCVIAFLSKNEHILISWLQ